MDLLKQKDCFFPNSMSDTESTKNINVLVNALWLIDKDNLKKLQQKIAALKKNNQESVMRYYSSFNIQLLISDCSAMVSPNLGFIPIITVCSPSEYNAN